MNYNEFMSKLILALTLILSLGFTTTSVADGQLSEHLHDIDYSGLSDASVCSWFQVVPVPEDFINEAKKRGLTCGGGKYYSNNKSTKNVNIPKNAYVSSSGIDGWRCLSGFNRAGDLCFPKNAIKNIPDDAYASGSSWICKSNFYRNKAKTACLPVPMHSTSSSSSNYFKCNTGYKLLGSNCITSVTKCKTGSYAFATSCLRLPSNALAYGSGDGFYCKTGYRKSSSANSCIRKTLIPSNAYAASNSKGWSCYQGYRQLGSSCVKSIFVPPNATQDSYGNTWNCNSGYFRFNNLCKRFPANSYALGSTFGCKANYYVSEIKSIPQCMRLPPNAIAYEAARGGYFCAPGFLKTTNNCAGPIPSNAYASDSGWKCNPGFEKNGNSCIEIPDDTIYRAGSGTGFATTYDGHILTNHHVIDGCTQVTVHNKGKSYITTVITQDPKNDLAILISDYKPSKIYTLSTEVYLSDDIYAAGFPFGKRISSSITVNRGIISALMGPGDDISKFQIDADINSGNSGGPIVDKQGNAIGIAVSKLNREKALEELGSVPEGFNFAVNSMMAIGLFRSQGIDLQEQNNSELSVKDRNDLFNQGTFYLACGMTTAQYEKMAKTDKVMFTREVFFSDFQGN